MTSKSTFQGVYVPSGLSVPYALRTHLNKFKVIGLNVFVRNPKINKGRPHGDWDADDEPIFSAEKDSLPALIKKYGEAASLGAVLGARKKEEAALADEKEWVKATDKQRETYWTARRHLEAYVQAELAKRKASDIKAASKLLSKYGLQISQVQVAVNPLVAKIRDAVIAYHADMDDRKNGNLAACKCVDEIQEILGMPWKQAKPKTKPNPKGARYV